MLYVLYIDLVAKGGSIHVSMVKHTGNVRNKVKVRRNI